MTEARLSMKRFSRSIAKQPARAMALAVLLLLNLTPATLRSQNAKRPLALTDIPGWKTIGATALSDDGNYLCYELNPLKGDGKLVIAATGSSTADTVARAKSGRFTADSRFAVFRIEVAADTLKAAKRRKVKDDQMPLAELGIFDLKARQTTRFANLQNVRFAENQTTWLAFTCRPDTVVSLKDKSKLSNLVFYRFGSGDTLMIRRVQDFEVDRDGRSFLYQTHSADSTNTVALYRFDTQTGRSQQLYRSPGTLKNIRLNQQGDQWAFLFSADTTKNKRYDLFAGNLKTPATCLVSAKTPGMPAGWTPSVNQQLQYSDNNKLLFFGTAPFAADEPDKTGADDEKPGLDVWSWRDKTLMPAQLIQKNREMQRTYTAVYHLNEHKLVQLGDSLIPQIQVSPKSAGNLVLGSDPSPYEFESTWTGRRAADYYVIDTRTGSRKLLVKNETRVRISPAESYLLWFEPADSSYYSLDLKNKNAAPVNLTRSLPTNFCNESIDTPSEAEPYGIAGWATADRYVYVYDRFDIWQLDPSGKTAAEAITGGAGKNRNTTFRFVKTDPEAEFMPADSWLLSGFCETDKSDGFYRFDPKTKNAPRQLIAGDYAFGFKMKAKNADRLLWTRESCSAFPDLHVGPSTFANPRKISEANPEQAQFNWATRELVSWTSFSGEKLEGILYFPEDFDSSKSYPMIVYYYETLSNTLNSYSVPAPSRSTINRSYYPSNGYLVFIPDITYHTGYPGQSAYNAVISGVSALMCERKYIDQKRIGLQGQSWGGYQTAYLITQTNLFAAAMAGAPVSNMTSAYGGIRWESGMSRVFQYEHGQSRIGGTLWDKPMRYIENSPLFYVPQINTPLLMMHNDNDGAVPWYQGIELYVAMRRLSKPVWLLNYNNEPHNLKAESWANRMDLTQRMMQFFDHYLKGAPAPEWMENGVPATQKGKSLGL